MPATKSPHFFEREGDRSVRLRLRFGEDVADLIEEAAGNVPLIEYIVGSVTRQAELDVQKAREGRPQVRPQL